MKVVGVGVGVLLWCVNIYPVLDTPYHHINMGGPGLVFNVTFYFFLPELIDNNAFIMPLYNGE